MRREEWRRRRQGKEALSAPLRPPGPPAPSSHERRRRRGPKWGDHPATRRFRQAVAQQRKNGPPCQKGGPTSCETGDHEASAWSSLRHGWAPPWDPEQPLDQRQPARAQVQRLSPGRHVGLAPNPKRLSSFAFRDLTKREQVGHDDLHHGSWAAGETGCASGEVFLRGTGCRPCPARPCSGLAKAEAGWKSRRSALRATPQALRELGSRQPRMKAARSRATAAGRAVGRPPAPKARDKRRTRRSSAAAGPRATAGRPQIRSETGKPAP